MELPAEKEYYTFADILAWDENENAEIIDGEVYMMSAPLRFHQDISGRFYIRLGNYLEGKKCRVYSAPFSVRLFEKEGDRPEDVDTIVEPDISVICDPNKLDKYGCRGAPDLVVEILSPSNQRHDRFVKFLLYQRAGVREYWIVDPEEKSVQVFLLKDGILRPHAYYGSSEIAKVNVLEYCYIDLNEIFAD